MPRDFSRSDRVADAIQKALALIIGDQLRDPRIGMVNVNAVVVSRNLAHAKVFVTFVDNPKNTGVEERVGVLNRAAGFLRKEVGQHIQMRVVPQLNFIFDETVFRALEISDLIDRAMESDSAKHHD